MNLRDIQQVSAVPIPLSAKRRKQRGYNQIELLLKPIVRETGHVYAPQYIKRTRDTAPQTSLNRADRLHNLKDAFVVPEKYTEHIRGAHIIVVDDVTTTGATQEQCELRSRRTNLLPHLRSSRTLTRVYPKPCTKEKSRMCVLFRLVDWQKFGQKNVKISYRISIWLKIFSIFSREFCQSLERGGFWIDF
ncbi:MAG: hypothetical protein R3B69_01615 [Candidatus Paceibacterota bacterium]